MKYKVVRSAPFLPEKGSILETIKETDHFLQCSGMPISFKDLEVAEYLEKQDSE